MSANVILRSLMLLTLLLGLLNPGHTASAMPALQAFTAHYAVYLDGKQRGEGRIQLEALGKGLWRYRVSATGTSGMARLAGFESDAYSEFRLAADGRIQLLRLSSASHALFKSRQVKAELDWDRQRADWSGDLDADRRAPTALTQRATSTALLNLMLARDAHAAHEGDAFTYQMLDRGRGKPVHYVALAAESITVPAGRYLARAMRYTRQDKPRTTTAWFTDALPWAPIRLLQTDNGKAKYELRLLRVE